MTYESPYAKIVRRDSERKAEEEVDTADPDDLRKRRTQSRVNDLAVTLGGPSARPYRREATLSDSDDAEKGRTADRSLKTAQANRGKGKKEKNSTPKNAGK